jgi:hypothetical protein
MTSSFRQIRVAETGGDLADTDSWPATLNPAGSR